MLKKINKSCLMLVCMACTLNSHALQPLDEHALSKTSAQDGLTIQLNTDITLNRFMWIDHDGLQPVNGQNFGIATPEQGILVIGDPSSQLKIFGGNTIIKVDADAGVQGPFINIAIELPEDLEIQTGNIYVAKRDQTTQALMQSKIMDSMKIHLGGLSMNIQLGNTPQGELAKVYGQIDNGIRVTNIGILDGNSNQIASMDELKVTNYGDSTKFTFDGTGVSIAPYGILVTPSNNKMMDVSFSNFKIGGNNSSSMGEMYISGLNIGNNVLTIAGH